MSRLFNHFEILKPVRTLLELYDILVNTTVMICFSNLVFKLQVNDYPLFRKTSLESGVFAQFVRQFMSKLFSIFLLETTHGSQMFRLCVNKLVSSHKAFTADLVLELLQGEGRGFVMSLWSLTEDN